MIVSFIVRLSLPIDPAAIIRAIVAIRVDTVDCERFAVSVRYRPGVESSEIVPLVAYPYTSCSVKLVIRIVTAVATGFKTAPYVVQPCMSVSVFSIRSVLIDYHLFAPSR